MTGTHIFFAGLRLLLALVFTVSAVTKLTDRDGFRSSLAGFGVLERFRPSVAVFILVVELLIAVGFSPAISAEVAAVSALGLLFVFTLLIATSLARGKRPECHRFGQLSSAPVGWNARPVVSDPSSSEQFLITSTILQIGRHNGFHRVYHARSISWRSLLFVRRPHRRESGGVRPSGWAAARFCLRRQQQHAGVRPR
jgi:hypothetical protein